MKKLLFILLPIMVSCTRIPEETHYKIGDVVYIKPDSLKVSIIAVGGLNDYLVTSGEIKWDGRVHIWINENEIYH